MKRATSSVVHLRLAGAVFILMLALVLLIGGSTALAAPAVPASPVLPSMTLGEISQGARAVDVLGPDLPVVAKAYGLTASELQERFARDGGLRIDRKGRLFYVCNAPAATELAAAAEAVLTGTSPAPLADTFRLHSKPGAERVIYLDFTGDTLIGTAWNDHHTSGAAIVAPPWDTDGNPASFGDSERLAIQEIWQRVAEDYAPFAVDVTTERPTADAITRSSLGDTRFGTRVLISPITASEFEGAGGIAYVNIFAMVDTSDYYKPALIFPQRLANSPRYIAEAVSHEAGHNLGLHHDGLLGDTEYYSGHGTGLTSWAPIMGVGYHRNLTQWSKGEYAGASNTEDDLLIMQQNGIPADVDDHGNTLGTATEIESAGTVQGCIGSPTDSDYFKFATAGGAASFTVATAAIGPNLDAQLELLDSAGQVLLVDNPLGELGASISTSLAAGTYYLRVLGVGEGVVTLTGYSNYGSLGRYTLTASFAPLGAQITAISPSFGSIDGNNTVVITGTGFEDVTDVLFGDVSAVYTVESATRISAKAPAQAAGSVQVKVVTSAGTTAVTPAAVYRYVGLPSIVSVSPSQSTSAGGVEVTITGTGFVGVSAVHFGSVAATRYTVVSETSIKATAPAQAAGQVHVRVTAAGGATVESPASAFTYTLVPTRYEQTSPLLYYQGSWTQASSYRDSGGSYKYSNNAGAAVTATFTGTSVDLVARTARTMGTVRITLDNNEPVIVDLYSALTGYQRTVWSISGLADTSHTLLIERTGQRGAGTGTTINIDALDILGTLTQTPQPPVPTRYEQTSPLLYYQGSWTQASSYRDSGGSYKYSNNAGAAVTATFTGTSVDLVARTARTMGTVRITLDNNEPVIVDLYSALTGYQRTVWSISGLADTSHTLLIERTGQRGAGTGTTINIDALDILGTLTQTPQPPVPTRYEQTSPLLYYQGSWTQASSYRDSGGSYKYSNNAGAAVTATFTGTSVDLVARTARTMGTVRITLDNNEPVIVDLYSALTGYQRTVWSISGLADTSHTLLIERTGQRGAGTGTTINIDALDILGTLTQTPQPPVPTRYEQTSPLLYYQGSWTQASSYRDSGGSYKYSNNAGAAVTATFTGTSVDLVARTARTMGTVRITLDNNEPVIVDLYSALTGYQRTVWSISGLADTSHTLLIERTGQRGAGTGTTINIDALDILGTLTQTPQPPVPTRYEQTSPLLYYQGSWTQASSYRDSGGSYKYSNNAGAAVTATFTGTSVDLVARTARTMGTVRITLDNNEPVIVDLYSALTGYQRTVWSISGLADTSHTLLIERTGQRGAGTGTTINIDALDILGTLTQTP